MRKIMLNGRWELAEAGKDTLCAVQVPGSVLSGLYGAGKIEDPFYRTNEDATRELFWIMNFAERLRLRRMSLMRRK